MEVEWVEDKNAGKDLNLEERLREQQDSIVKEIIDKFREMHKEGKVYAKYGLSNTTINYRRSILSNSRTITRITRNQINSNIYNKRIINLNFPAIEGYAANQEEFDALKKIFSKYYERIGYPENLKIQLVNIIHGKVYYINNFTPPKKVNQIP